jgi:hypothetical protein
MMNKNLCKKEQYKWSSEMLLSFNALSFEKNENPIENWVKTNSQ